MQSFLIAVGMIWAFPYSLLGLIIGSVGLFTGGHAQRRGRTLEFYGGFVSWFVRHLPLGEFTIAFTLGHTILAQTAAGLDIARDHEMIHVRQFERWGLFMGPAYIGASLLLWILGHDPYRDNPFECEPYNQHNLK